MIFFLKVLILTSYLNVTFFRGYRVILIHEPNVAVADLRCGGGDVVEMALGGAVGEQLVGHVRQVDADDGEGVPECNNERGSHLGRSRRSLAPSIAVVNVKSEIKTTAVMQHHHFFHLLSLIASPS